MFSIVYSYSNSYLMKRNIVSYSKYVIYRIFFLHSFALKTNNSTEFYGKRWN